MAEASDPASRLARLLEANELLRDVSAKLGPDLALDDVLHTVLNAMRRLVDFRGGTVQLVDERGVYVAASDPRVDDEVLALRVRVGEGISGRVVATGAAMYSPDIEHDARVSASTRFAGWNVNTHSYLAVPLVCLGEVIGTLQIDSERVDAFDEDDIALLEALAAQVAGVVESARRYLLVTELERLKSDFLSRVSHELRTPITIIDGLLQTLLAHHDIEPAQQRDMLERSRAAVARLAGLVEELLTLSRLETGVLAAAAVPTPLAAAMADVAAASVRPGDVTIECDAGASAIADPDLLRRALSTLVDNALKYAGHAHLVGSLDGTVEVVDGGPGLPVDVQSAAFELFTRGSSTLSVPGLGLGLPLARTLIDAMGGRLTLAPRPGGGTIARVSLLPVQ